MLTTVHYSHCDFHLGDNLVFLHFLRHLASKAGKHHEFMHAAHACHLEQLYPVVEDVPNVWLFPLEDGGGMADPAGAGRRWPGHSRDVWKNAGAGTPNGGFWERHPKRLDFAGFCLEWFRHLAAEMGMESPFKEPRDLLFDYPAIAEAYQHGAYEADVLVVNSQPCSGQFRAYDRLDYLDPLIEKLAAKHYVAVTQACGVKGVECTREMGKPAAPASAVARASSAPASADAMTVTEIGALSIECKAIVMIATGPSWPTFNVWNERNVQLRVVLMDNGERLELAPNTVHAATREEAEAVLKEKGYL